MTNTTPPSYSMEGNEIISGGKIANWQKGYRAINAYAATIFRTDPYHILGLQHLSNRDADWIRQPGHNALTPRTDDWARTPITAVMNVAQQATARDNNLGADNYGEKKLELFNFALKVIGPTICETLAEQNPLGTGVINMTLLQIVAFLDITEGVASSMDYSQLKALFEAPIHWDGTIGCFDKFVNDGNRILADLQRQGTPINREDQLSAAKSSVSHYPHLKAGCDQYTTLCLFPVGGAPPVPTRLILMQTIRSYIAANPTSLSGQQIVYHAANSISPADAPSPALLAAISSMFESSLAAATTRSPPSAGGGGRGRGYQGKADRGRGRGSHQRSGGRSTSSATSKYCYLHGYCTHYGFKCYHMLADKTKYNDGMLAAQSPTSIPGGAP
jgi:hypothetical protein